MIRIVGIGLLALAVAGSAHGAELVGYFRPSVRVAADRVDLGEVVQLSGEQAERWSREPFVAGLQPGSTRQVERRDVERVLAKAGVELIWRGAERTTISRLAPAAAPEQVVARAQQMLEDALAGRYSSVSVRPVRQRLPAIDASFTLRLPSDLTARRRMAVFVDRVEGNRVRQSVPVWFEVEAYRDVLVAARDIPARALLTPELLTMERRNVVGASAPVLSIDGQRFWTTAPLLAGAMLTSANAAPAPAVRANAPVAVLVAVGAIRLEAKGTALTSGQLGDQVRVAPVKGVTEPFVAQVVGDDRVLVR